MKNILRIAILGIAVSGISNLFAQPGCPAVDAGPDVIMPCGQTCTTLNATAFSAATTSAYTVGQIAYNPPFPFNAGTNILVAIDDVWGNVINLPFNFCFFGNVYNQLIVGSNGMISFNLNNANGLNNWQIQGPIPANYWGDMCNTIMCPWQDIDPTNQGGVYYQISGTYPCRSFEVSWFQTPYYGDPNSVTPGSCPNPLFGTQQVVLYEVSNVIEMYIQNKEVCSGWNNGRAIQGLLGPNCGPDFAIVPGRNGTQWTAQNDAWRFTPAGTPNYTIAWYDGVNPIATTNSVQVCPATSQSYTAQATYTNCDGSNTTVSDNVFVGISGISISIDSTRNPLCFNGTDGAAYASYTSTGSAVLSYGWSPLGVPNQTSITNVPAGTYVFSVTDATNCSRYDTVTLTNPAPLLVTVPDSNAYNCNPGLVSGALTAYVTGADTACGNLSYTWNSTPVQNTATASGLGAGLYSVTVLDCNGCSARDNGTVIAVIAPPVFNPEVIQDASCNGASDGSIIVSLGQSTPPVIYTWSPVVTGNDTATGLSAGPYNVTGTDLNGCSASATYTVNEPAVLSISPPAITPVTCSAAGSISVTATGGTGAYTFVWSNSETGSFIDSLQAGIYILTVTDQNSCTVTDTFTVTTAPGAVAIGQPLITHVNCNSGSTGSITATASGGTPPIGFVWSNGVTVATNGNIPAGCYSVTASDVNGCSASATYCITEPSAIVIDTATITQATCQAGGTISVSATGGTGTLTYVWSNFDTGTFIDSLAAASYVLTVTDQNLCTVVANYTVTAAPGVVYFLPPVITNATCNGDSTGSITASPAGGTGPISVLWNYNNAVTVTISGIPAGSYSVTITDTAGCSATTTYIVNQPTAIVPVITFTSLICLNTTGNGCVSATGGTPGYTYLWNNFTTTSCATNLFPGEVRVTVTDATGCTAAVSDTINTAPDYNVTSVVKPFPCANPPYGNDTITVSGGIGPFTYSVLGVDTNTTGVFNDLPPGNYTWVIADSLGCTKSSIFTIPQSAADDIFTVITDSTSCFGSQFSDGSITITPESANGPYTYSLDSGPFQSGNTFTGLAAGTYSITTSNVYGCQTTVTAVVEQPAQVFANANPDIISTPPGIDTALVVTVQNFNNPVYTWTPAEGLSCTDCSNPTANVSAATVFYVTVSETDNSNCLAVDSVVFIITGGFAMPNAFTPNGDGENDDFGPVKSGLLVIKEFRIYSRWGEMIHNTTDYWNGIFSSKEQPAGTYVYYIRVETPDRDNPGAQKAETKQGSFTLLR